MWARPSVVSLLVLGCIAVPMTAAAPQVPDATRAFVETVQPFLHTYCTGCHSGAKPAAELDLRQYATVDAVVEGFPRWNRVLARLSAREMPPAQATQPPDRARQQVIEWIQTTWATEARRRDGDPGVVLARRLSNAEYNYTIRDLTGIDIHPAREFPVDPANQAGFDNSGESLAMSPALLNKYLLAARTVADHMFLNATGFDFAPHPMLVETDRDRYCIQEIVDFYARQNTDYADYFRAAWIYKHRAVLAQPHATLADVAAQQKVSATYLTTIWKALETKEEIGPMTKLQSMWHALPVPTARSTRVDVARDGANRMRDYVVRMRKDTSLVFGSPTVKGLSVRTQPLMNWKLREYATHRRDFDRAALRVEGEAPPVEPTIPLGRDGKPVGYGLVGLGPNGEDLTALKAQLRAYASRMENADLVVPRGQRARYEAAFATFSSVFPDAFYVRERGRFYPDETEDAGRLLSAGFHNVMGYTRDDAPLSELILDEKGRKELERLWHQFEFVADYTARTYVQFYFNQSGEVLGNGAESGTLRPSDTEVTVEPVVLSLKTAFLAKAAADDTNSSIARQAITDHFDRVNATLRSIEKARIDAEPRHLDALLTFASRAYRRPLAPAERADVLAFYRSHRAAKNLTHEEAMRDAIVSVLMSPRFCYRLDLTDGARRPALSKVEGPAAPSQSARNAVPSTPLSDDALASRLSYFLWSSMPDAELLSQASTGRLRSATVLRAEIRRMLKDDRARRLTTEFGGNWLDFRRFEESNTVDRERFPAFTNELREAMFEEPIRFLDDVIRNDRPVLDLLYGDYTFVNPILARHYGMPEVKGAPDQWIRVDHAGDYQRGGLLPMAVFLTQNAPGLRTSPVKRGYWVVRRLLGEVIPPPPPVVPELPTDEAKLDLPLREKLAQHRSNPACASCHARFDAFGLTLENYGPIGETRTHDLAGHPVDTQAAFPGGRQGKGLSGLQAYIRATREQDFLDNLSRKLLVYALGRSPVLSDEALIQRMNAGLAASGYRVSALIETIVTSPQFLNRRTAATTGRKAAN